MLREEYQELLDSKITLHDRRRFEIKLDVNLVPGQEANSYTVEAYFFVPRSLDVTRSTYTPEKFYSDIQNYIRFKTPVRSLGKLMDDAYEYSPFVQLELYLGRLLQGETDDATIGKAVHELKLLGCIVRAAVRDYVNFSLAELKTLGAHEAKVTARSVSLQDGALSFMKDVHKLLERVRGMRSRFQNPALPDRVRQSYAYLDEYLSLMVESYFTIFLDELGRRPNVAVDVPILAEELKSLVATEQRHRLSMGYPSVIQPGSENESFIPRRSMLKKFISSILFLEIDVSRRSAARELLFGVSAFLVMLMYLVLMVLVQSRFAFNSLPFVLLGSIGYIFKDRIKEWLRTYFTGSLGWMIVDHKVKIVDPATRQTLGEFQESFHFMEPKAVPAEVARLHALGHEAVGEEGIAEDVMLYAKVVRLHPDRILKFHHRLKSLNDILRFSVANFLVKTDDPKEDQVFLDPRSGQLEHVRLTRTYGVEVILRYRAVGAKDRGTDEYEKVRLIIDRKGIKRLETLSPEALAAASVFGPSR